LLGVLLGVLVVEGSKIYGNKIKIFVGPFTSSIVRFFFLYAAGVSAPKSLTYHNKIQCSVEAN
jgi:hypothetical protein